MTLYVGPNQEAAWTRARQIATETRRSLSQVVADALAAYVADYDSSRLGARDRAVRTILLRAAEEIGSIDTPKKTTTRRTR